MAVLEVLRPLALVRGTAALVQVDAPDTAGYENIYVYTLSLIHI